MRNTPQQEALFKWVDHQPGNGMLKSVAGSGKTTSIIESLNYIDDELPVIVCSFTKLVATELEKRVRALSFSNVTSTTLNSLGWGVCKANVQGIKLDAYKTDNIFRWWLNQNCDRDFAAACYKTGKNLVKRVIGLLKSYVVDPNENDFKTRLQDIIFAHDVELPEGQSPAAVYLRKDYEAIIYAVYVASIKCLMEMDFDDQKFMPVYYGWKGKAAHFVIVDECQDCNYCDIQLLKSFGDSNTRYLWVGDPSQSIYGFRGSLPNAMDLIAEEFNCHQMSLTVCWRCPDAVLKLAKELCPEIAGPIPNPRGDGIAAHITTPEFKDLAMVGDYVICRTTAPLVKRCLEFVRANKPAKVKGKDVGRTLLNLIELIEGRLSKAGISGASLPEFIQDLQLYKTEQLTVLEAAGRDELAIAVSDKCEALEAFCLDSSSIRDVSRKIDLLFQDDVDDDAVVLFMTGHKCKGLQRKRVFFLRPDLSPHPRSKSETASKQERNLRYVIITRAESELYFVMKEKEER